MHVGTRCLWICTGYAHAWTRYAIDHWKGINENVPWASCGVALWAFTCRNFYSIPVTWAAFWSRPLINYHSRNICLDGWHLLCSSSKGTPLGWFVSVYVPIVSILFPLERISSMLNWWIRYCANLIVCYLIACLVSLLLLLTVLHTAVLPEACLVSSITRILWRFGWPSCVYWHGIQVLFTEVAEVSEYCYSQPKYVLHSQPSSDALMPLICCRMIEIGQKSFPQIFRQEGLAQKVLMLHILILWNLLPL